MTDYIRLIETEGFPLDAASEASASESSANRGSIRTLHRYPARRPLAACRAAILATLLPDPGNREDRLKMRDMIGELLQRDTGETKELLRARELLQQGRDEPWRVLDPFAGGGSIPFEALRLGCQVESSDLNPVAWFVQMATMYYPSKIGLDEMPLPDILKDDPDCLAAAGGQISGSTLKSWGAGEEKSTFNLAEHVAAWGTLLAMRCNETLKSKYQVSKEAIPTGYIWFRTFSCPECLGAVPVFNSSILHKSGSEILSAVIPIIDKENKSIEWNVKCKNTGDELSSHEKISFKSKNKITCPFCNHISVTSKEIRRDAQENGLGHELVAVVENHDGVRKYRSPFPDEGKLVQDMIEDEDFINYNTEKKLFHQPIPKSGQGASRGFTVGLYGMTEWKDIFNPRQYWAVNRILDEVKKIMSQLDTSNYSEIWKEAITVYLTLISNQTMERNTSQCRWYTGAAIQGLFDTYTLPVRWGYAESFPTSKSSGSMQLNISRVSKVLSNLLTSCSFTPNPIVIRRSALDSADSKYSLILTDPPYYDQIPYSDTLDFFYIMIKELCGDLNDTFRSAFKGDLSPKWDSDSNEKELIDDAKRHDDDKLASKMEYENGMADVFSNLYNSLESGGRLVVVFAHKNPEAWETLVSALIRSGFQTTAAWPIRTEKAAKVSSGMRAFLSTSVWLVLKKRDPMADYAFDREVFASIKDNTEDKLRRFWDAGIRGPDFLWAALGPGLEVYSQYEVVRKFESADDGDELVSVGEFLDKVRDIVLRFSIGRLLTDYGSGEDEAEQIDDLTRYYLLHRSWFGHIDVDAGEVTKFAVACGFTDSQLSGKADILSTMRGKKRRLAVAAETAAADAQADADNRGGSKYVLNRWNERTPPKEEGTFNNEERSPSLIDHVHRLLHLRLEGDKQAMDAHIKHWALGGHPVMPALVQALQEICKEEGSKSGEELSLLESLSKDLERLAGAKPAQQITLMDYLNEEDD